MFYDSTFSLVNLVEEGTWATFKVREEENFFAYFWPIELVKKEWKGPPFETCVYFFPKSLSLIVTIDICIARILFEFSDLSYLLINIP